MKKLVTMSLVAVMGMAGSAFAENARLSDVVRTLEENPELIEPVGDMLNAARAVSSYTISKYQPVAITGKTQIVGSVNPVKIQNPVEEEDPEIVALGRYKDLKREAIRRINRGDCYYWRDFHYELMSFVNDPWVFFSYKRNNIKELADEFQDLCE